MTSRLLHHAAFAAGLAVIGWVAAGYAGRHPLALTLTLLVGAFYLLGAWELLHFSRATGTLARAVAELVQAPPALAPWLERLPPSLRHAVRLRIEGERVALPGPGLAGYLPGLLVLLGMLGTFLGMVVTLNGTGAALQSATDVPAVRDALTAPVRGLGLAFGTSVAGVAASAMLGLMAALCRRERLHAGQALDACAATMLRGFSHAHQREQAQALRHQQREQSLALLQRQAGLMPQLVDRLQSMTASVERQAQASHEQLAASQQGFHEQAQARHAALAASVERSLLQGAAESARQAGATLQPIMDAALAGWAREAQALHERVAQAAQQQMEAAALRLQAMTAQVAQAWQGSLAEHERSGQRLLAQAHDTLATALQSQSAALHEQWQRLSAQTLAQQQQLCDTLADTAREVTAGTGAQARATIDEAARLLQAAAEAPRAAAAAIAELRQKLADSLARDNAMLDERARLMQTLNTLLDAVNRACGEQRAAIDALVAQSAALMERTGARLSDTLQAQTERLDAAGAQLAGGAVEVASLGEAFGFAVQRFGESNDQLVGQLQRIEAALGQSLARSDEQLAYYVAQAREVIDLSLLSQKQVIEELQQLARRQPAGSPA